MCGMPMGSRSSCCSASEKRHITSMAAASSTRQPLEATVRPTQCEQAGWDLPATIWAAIVLAKAARS
jgi:hypothetical protein